MNQVQIGIGMLKVFIFAAFVTAPLAGCQNRTVVYTSPTPRSSITYVRTPTRVVTNTVYARASTSNPTALPGAPSRLPEAGEPSNFPAATTR